MRSCTDATHLVGDGATQDDKCAARADGVQPAMTKPCWGA
jgi:hypothetical protein